MDPQEQSAGITQASWPKPFDLFKQAFSLYSSRLKNIAPIALLAWVAGLLQTVVSPQATGLSLVASLLSFVVMYLSYIAFVYVFAHEDPRTQSYLAFYQKAWAILIPYTLVSLIISCATFGGFMIFIIPGIIVGVYLSMAVYIVALEGLKGFRALTQSYIYVKGDWWRVFGRILFFVLVTIVIMLGVGFVVLILAGNSLIADVLLQAFQIFFIVPISVAYFYLLYQILRDRKAGPIMEPNVIKVRNGLLTCIIIGLILGFIWLTVLGPRVKKYYNTHSHSMPISQEASFA